MAYLIQTQEIYRAESEREAQELISEAKQAGEYTLTKYSSEKKEVKAKGEVIDEYFKISLTKTFTNIKEPDVKANVIYEVE